MRTTVDIAELMARTKLPRQTIYSWADKGLLPMNKVRTSHSRKAKYMFPEEAVDIALAAAALRWDVSFSLTEVRNILAQVSAAELRKLLRSVSYPRLLKELRRRRVKLQTTDYLDGFVRDRR